MDGQKGHEHTSSASSKLWTKWLIRRDTGWYQYLIPFTVSNRRHRPHTLNNSRVIHFFWSVPTSHSLHFRSNGVFLHESLMVKKAICQCICSLHLIKLLAWTGIGEATVVCIQQQLVEHHAYCVTLSSFDFNHIKEFPGLNDILSKLNLEYQLVMESSSNEDF